MNKTDSTTHHLQTQPALTPPPYTSTSHPGSILSGATHLQGRLTGSRTVRKSVRILRDRRRSSREGHEEGGGRPPRGGGWGRGDGGTRSAAADGTGARGGGGGDGSKEEVIQGVDGVVFGAREQEGGFGARLGISHISAGMLNLALGSRRTSIKRRKRSV